MLRYGSLAALVLAAITPAHAQQAVSTQILLAGNACTEAQGGNDAVIATCKTALDNLNEIVRANSISGHEGNLYWTMSALAHTRIGSSMGALDGVRSARSCHELEEAWKAFVALKPDTSPPDYAADMRNMKAKAAAPVALCRSEFGTPPLAPDLS